ncbi:MAG: hypothetical protein V8S31_11605 [Lachnospiraceae bacterium]
MIEAVYEAIKNGEDVRQNLSKFRQCMKEEAVPEQADTSVFIGLLFCGRSERTEKRGVGAWRSGRTGGIKTVI